MIDFPLTNEDVHHVNAEWAKIVPAGRNFIQSPEPLLKIFSARPQEGRISACQPARSQYAA
jgi:hypothetical protein